jgi:hypothetical protein
VIGLQELAFELESIGTDFQAYTYKEFMRFYLTPDPKYFQKLSKIAAGSKRFNCAVVSIGNKKGLSEKKLHEILLKTL